MSKLIKSELKKNSDPLDQGFGPARPYNAVSRDDINYKNIQNQNKDTDESFGARYLRMFSRPPGNQVDNLNNKNNLNSVMEREESKDE